MLNCETILNISNFDLPIETSRPTAMAESLTLSLAIGYASAIGYAQFFG